MMLSKTQPEISTLA